jgi:hypothetical protein
MDDQLELCSIQDLWEIFCCLHWQINSVKRENLDTPLSLQLAVQGSRSKVNTRATVKLEYQEINEMGTFDIININNYDVILGTP